jgi:hypothetical protein
LPLTIILFTGGGAALFLIVSLLWREYKENKGIKNAKEKKNIDFEDKIRGEIIDISDQRALGKIDIDQAKKMIEVRLAFAAEEIKAMKPVMIALCGGNGEYSKDDYDKFYSLWKNFQPLQTNVANLLLTRAAPKIPTGEISKQTIEFLSSITDGDLEVLKKQFKYVLRLPHQDTKTDISSKDLAIWHFEDSNSRIQNLLLKENGLMHIESYHIRFYGDIWVGEATRASAYLLKDKTDVICDIDNKETALQICYKQEPVKGMVVNPIVFPSYVCLSGVGMEIFNLLKDEIESPPQEYLNSVIKYWGTENPQYNFSLIEKTKSTKYSTL